MNPNVGVANMNPMGGERPVPVPMPGHMMGNGGMANPQQPNAAALAAAGAPVRPQQNQRSRLNTYIYEYFVRYGMYDAARALLNADAGVANKDGANRRRDENGNIVNGIGDDAMDTDNKDDLDTKSPDDLPPPKLPTQSDNSFLYDWFCLFWEIYDAQRGPKPGNNAMVNQYVAHTQNRMRQNQHQEMLRQMRPDMQQSPQYQQMMRMQGNMAVPIQKQALARTAMANNQNHPQMQQMMQQQAKQNQMQRDPSGMDNNRDRPSSPAGAENAPSPSKRQRVDGTPFSPNQPGVMMANGRGAPGVPNPQMAQGHMNSHNMLQQGGVQTGQMTAQQYQNFMNAPQAAQNKSLANYSASLQQQQGSQMGKPNGTGPQNQGSPMMAQGPDGSTLNTFYNPGEMSGSGVPMQAGPNMPGAGGSNHALQDYQMQLMLLEQQNKKRLLMARQEQDVPPGGRDGGPGPSPGGPTGPNGQPFPETSPQAMRTGTSPNPTDQMKRGTPQMNNAGIPSPNPEGGPSRDSPNPNMNFMGNHVDPNGMAGPFNMAGQAQMNGMRPPNGHPGGPQFNGPMNPQMMAQQRAQQQPQPGGNPQWKQGLNGQMIQQGTPQPRSMPPPSAPAAQAAQNANRATASPQQPAAAPPTPNQGNKAAPKKKETKAAKEKRVAAQKKSNQNLNNSAATPATDNGDGEAPTPITPANGANFKNGAQGNSAGNGQPTATAPPPAPQSVVAQAPTDPNQNGSMNMNDFSGFGLGPMELADPMQSGDVLNDFDFDSFLHDNEDHGQLLDFNGTFPSMEGGEIGADQ